MRVTNIGGRALGEWLCCWVDVAVVVWPLNGPSGPFIQHSWGRPYASRFLPTTPEGGTCEIY